MYDSRVEWEGLGWRNKSTVSACRVYIKGREGGTRSELGKWSGPRADFQGTLQPVDIGKMKEKETGKGSHEVRGELRE